MLSISYTESQGSLLLSLFCSGIPVPTLRRGRLQLLPGSHFPALALWLVRMLPAGTRAQHIYHLECNIKGQTFIFLTGAIRPDQMYVVRQYTVA